MKNLFRKTYDIAVSHALDAGDVSAQRAQHPQWDEHDFNVAWATFLKFLPAAQALAEYSEAQEHPAVWSMC